MLNYNQQKEAFRKLSCSSRRKVLETCGSFKNAFDSGLVIHGKRVMVASPLVLKECASAKECFDLLDGFKSGS